MSASNTSYPSVVMTAPPSLQANLVAEIEAVIGELAAMPLTVLEKAAYLLEHVIQQFGQDAVRIADALFVQHINRTTGQGSMQSFGSPGLTMGTMMPNASLGSLQASMSRNPLINIDMMPPSPRQSAAPSIYSASQYQMGTPLPSALSFL